MCVCTVGVGTAKGELDASARAGTPERGGTRRERLAAWRLVESGVAWLLNKTRRCRCHARSFSDEVGRRKNRKSRWQAS
eukprot:6214492-Pleurochrysis_carterae.AAC.2